MDKSNMEDIGRLLKETREGKGVNLKDVADALNIKLRYLQALEEGDIEKLSANIYLIGYVKSYARWLGIEENELLQTLSQSNVRTASISAEYIPSNPLLFGKMNHNVLRPSVTVVIISISVTLFLYMFWFHNNKVDDTDLASINQLGNNGIDTLQRMDVTNKTDKSRSLHKNFILFAKDKVSFTVFAKERQAKVSHVMNAGDAFFLSEPATSLIEVDKDHVIEVFVDDPQNTYLGTLVQTTELADFHRKIAQE